jgi:hypothetical protein
MGNDPGTSCTTNGLLSAYPVAWYEWITVRRWYEWIISAHSVAHSAAVVPRPVPRAGARRARYNVTQITEANHTCLLAPRTSQVTTAARAGDRACRLRDDVARPRVVASEMMSRYSGLHPRVRLRRRCTRTSGLGFARSSLPRGFVRSSLPRGLARSYLPRGFVRSYPSSCGL